MTPELTTAQLATLKAAILAETDATFVQHRNEGNNSGMAIFYNVLASPAHIAWKSAVTLDEIQQNGFDWTQVDNLTDPKARTWEWLFSNEQRKINPAKANVRAGIDEVWQGTAGKLAVRAQVYGHCKRSATRAEKLFASGTGSDASPAVMTAEGALTSEEVRLARES